MFGYNLLKLGFRPKPKKDITRLFKPRPELPSITDDVKLKTDIADREHKKSVPRFVDEFFSKFENFGNTNEPNDIAGRLPPL